MATSLYGCTGLNGSASGAMDTIKYAVLLDGDIAFVVDANEDLSVFRYESSSGETESSPKVIRPDDTPAGANPDGYANGRWILADMNVDDLTVYGNLVVTGGLNSDLQMNDATSLLFSDDTPASDHTVAGIKATLTAGENLVFGNFCYLKSDGKYWKADANAATTMPVIAMAAATISADDSGEFLMWGWARDDTWNWTVGGRIYASGTAGAGTQTAPSTSGDRLQVIGLATHADRMLFNPPLTTLTVN